MAVTDVVPNVEFVDGDAPRFAARMTKGGRLGVLRLPFLEDAWGGIEAGQPELVLEATLSLLENGITVYLAYKDVEVAAEVSAIEALRQVDPELASKAWLLASAAAGTPVQVVERFGHVMQFLEFELSVMGAVPSWAGRVTEEEYLSFRYESVYPAILLSERLQALELFPVPGTYLEAAKEAEATGHVVITSGGTL